MEKSSTHVALPDWLLLRRMSRLPRFARSGRNRPKDARSAPAGMQMGGLLRLGGQSVGHCAAAGFGGKIRCVCVFGGGGVNGEAGVRGFRVLREVSAAHSSPVPAGRALAPSQLCGPAQPPDGTGPLPARRTALHVMPPVGSRDWYCWKPQGLVSRDTAASSAAACVEQAPRGPRKLYHARGSSVGAVRHSAQLPSRAQRRQLASLRHCTEGGATGQGSRGGRGWRRRAKRRQ